LITDLAADPETLLADQQSAGELYNVIFEVLTARERHVIAGRFGLDDDEKSLEHISGEIGICRERVRQIERGVCRKLNLCRERFGVVLSRHHGPAVDRRYHAVWDRAERAREQARQWLALRAEAEAAKAKKIADDEAARAKRRRAADEARIAAQRAAEQSASEREAARINEAARQAGRSSDAEALRAKSEGWPSMPPPPGKYIMMHGKHFFVRNEDLPRFGAMVPNWTFRLRETRAGVSWLVGWPNVRGYS